MAEIGDLPVDDEQPQPKKAKVGTKFSSSLWNTIEIHPAIVTVTDDVEQFCENGKHSPENQNSSELQSLEKPEEEDEGIVADPGSQNGSQLVDSGGISAEASIMEPEGNLSSSSDGSDLSSAQTLQEDTETGETNEVVTTAEKTESPDTSSSDEIEEVVPTDTSSTEKKRKAPHQRRNIKEIIGQDKLDERTIAAQREEWARRERMAAKRQYLGKNPSLPLSLEQIMERFSSKSLVSMTPVDAEADLNEVTELPHPSVAAKAKQVEHEVLTLSSDDEDCVPVMPSPQECSARSVSSSSPLEAYPYCYPQFVSDSSRSRYSGGTMIVSCENDRLGPNAMTLNNETESEKGVIDADSDDDCVVLSPSAEVVDDDKDEDELNVPDALGRILINVGHPPEDPDIFLPPQIAQTIKPHQIGGIRFLYDNVIESLETFNTSSGLGCILAHSMGLGKTIQAAAFCDIFLNHTSGNTVLVIVPINTIQNWLSEFNQWLPSAKCAESSPTPAAPKKRGRKKTKPDSPATKEPESNAPSASASPDVSDPDETLDGEKGGSTAARSYSVFLLNETVKNLAGREKIISEWSSKGGVLLIGYEMYRMLALKKLKRPGKKNNFVLHDEEKLKKDMEDELVLDRIYNSLVKPGPDLVICDEGHRIKNSGASISQALKAIKTRRRIVLTGYPLQNNLMEYWCMVDFIRPNYLGTKNEFSNMFERPIINGQCTDSTSSDKRLMQFRSHVLHSVLEGFVQRRSHLVLQRALPPKEEWVFLLKMTPVQTSLYKEFISYIKLMAEMGNTSPNPIKAFAICCKIWNHPDVLYNVAVAKKDKSNLLDDLEDLAEEVEGLKKKMTRKKTKNDESNSNDSCIKNSGLGNIDESDSFPPFSNWGDRQGPSSYGNSRETMKDSLLSLEWALPALKDYKPNVLENGTKFELLFIIIEECARIGDKLLVFSQSLLTLDLMELFLGMKLQWYKNRDYFRLDGSTGGLERERLIKEFNSSSRPELRLFLVSTRAGSLGINLIGANRVVVFDASWNPCHDCQAVCRIYRYGQKKQCQIYRFVTDCTLEKKIYDRQITKRGMANRVVDEMNPDSHFNSKDMSGALLLELDNLEQLQSAQFQHTPEKYADPIMQKLLTKGGSSITRAPFEHESLLIDRKDKKLSAAERRLALRNYEMEKKAVANQGSLGVVPNSRHSYNSHYPKYPYSSGYPSGPWNNGSDYNFSNFPPMYSYGSGNSYSQEPLSNHSIPQDSYFPPEFSDSMRSRYDPTVPLPLPIDELRKKGVCVQGIILKKDSFLADPDNGPDIFLMAGQKVYLLRSHKGTYLRISNGRVIAIRKRGKGAAQTILDNVPSHQDLSKEQIYIVINSILRPKISSTLAHLQEYAEGGYQSTSRQSYASNLAQYSSYEHDHPVSVPLPPSYPYSSFQNQQNLQITNHNSSSGGDVTIWRKDATDPAPSSSHTTADLVPDIEVIKISPSPRKEVNELELLNELTQQGRQMNLNSFSPRLSNSFFHEHHPPLRTYSNSNPNSSTNLTPMDMELLESSTPVTSPLLQKLTTHPMSHSSSSSSTHRSRGRSPQLPSWTKHSIPNVPRTKLQSESMDISSIFPNVNFKEIEVTRPMPTPSFANFSDLISQSSSEKSSNVFDRDRIPSTIEIEKIQSGSSSGSTSIRRGDVVFETGPKVYGNGTSSRNSHSNILYDSVSGSSPSSSQFGQYYTTEKEKPLFQLSSIDKEILQQNNN